MTKRIRALNVHSNVSDLEGKPLGLSPGNISSDRGGYQDCKEGSFQKVTKRKDKAEISRREKCASLRKDPVGGMEGTPHQARWFIGQDIYFFHYTQNLLVFTVECEWN